MASDTKWKRPPMNGVCLVTSVDSPEPLKWGLEVERIAIPMVLLCRGDMIPVFQEGDLPPHVALVATDLPETLSLPDKLAGLHRACRGGYHNADCYYWLDIRLVYQHLSFEFLYGDVLTRAIGRFATGPAYFIMPGYEASSFFGGPKLVIEKLYEQRRDAPGGLFESPVPAPAQDTVFMSAFDCVRPVDLNLKLAAVIDAPVLHVVGDSHVLNCFTVNKAIGCRPNILVRTPDVSKTAVPYAYQFSHHLGSRTMHFAGRPGALLATAKDCGIKAGDAVVWVFGEIDARSHILRQRTEGQRALDEVIDTLARDYVRGILEVERGYEPLRSVVFAPIPPLDNPGYTSVELPIYGSIEERIAVTRQLRTALAALCERHGILFLDVAAQFETARGDLRWELSDRFCHIASGYQRPIVEGLYALLARDAGAAASPNA